MCDALQLYFPTVYDIKYLMKFCDNLHGGLNKLAEVLQVERIGPQHQVLHTSPVLCWMKHASSMDYAFLGLCCLKSFQTCCYMWQYDASAFTGFGQVSMLSGMYAFLEHYLHGVQHVHPCR